MGKILKFILILLFVGKSISGFSQDDEYTNLPSPLQIVMIFQNPDLLYDASLVHATDDCEKYDSKYKQLVNFGIYLADMAYAIQNDEFQTAGKFLRAIKILGEKNGMNKMFDNIGLYERFENNIDNRDSMLTILLDASLTFELYLADKSVMKVVSIQFAGIWIEGAYISSQIASFKYKESLNKLIVHQFPILSNIVKVLQNIPEKDPFHVELTNDLAELEEMMLKMKTIKKFMKKKDEIPLTETELKLVEEKIRIIRSKAIQK
jgi:hypothetical protein